MGCAAAAAAAAAASVARQMGGVPPDSPWPKHLCDGGGRPCGGRQTDRLQCLAAAGWSTGCLLLKQLVVAAAAW